MGFISYKPKPYQYPQINFFPIIPISEDNPLTYEGIELGRFLFYDSILSKNYDMNCASCHKQKYAFSNGPIQFSEGNNGKLTSRNAPALFNLPWQKSFFWDGRAKTIEELVFHPVRDSNEMNLSWNEAEKRLNNSKFYKNKFKKAFQTDKIDSTLITKAIGQFLRTLLSYNSKFDRVINGKEFLTKEEYKGFEIVNTMSMGDCLHCHTSDSDMLGSTYQFSNNGIDSVSNYLDYKDYGLANVTHQIEDYGKFKIPSIRNLAFTAPYMHDGRFKTLKEVIDFYSEGVHKTINIDSKMTRAKQKGVKLTEDEKEYVIAFLKTLSDSSFVTNPNFSNPFYKE